MEFPYSVAGLTAQHLKMRWPDIDEPYAPDRPGTRFRMPSARFPSCSASVTEPWPRQSTPDACAVACRLQRSPETRHSH
jgi:hypothetical protein